uniref:Membrane protein m160 n=1 Tax=Mastomys natalensis cytomegalovirus 2 TaxID=2973540 RepID=A0A9Y1N6L2_9BETA|nr:membrane protein m160 [Mastomys natalensis cytomegalovirus 2]WEG69288.1 membrane protein m160 [Mastomys natalensis cytomegalovirus 2]WEG69427.1 membrane protein m160 [Mastomys natalensis cytomegalovirus 2]WEG69565.1 membrane protein m160 [Mastomys natalensis cytomegalovirus 2]WEG69703.1 membrane protein m160 [Mastomys natalensis cytomegalovirus 2]
MALLLWYLSTMMIASSHSTIEVVHDGGQDGTVVLRCLWTSGPRINRDEIRGSWHQLCYGDEGESALAVFSSTGTTVFRPSLQGESWGGVGGKRATLTSVIRMRPECNSLVVCAVGHEEAAVDLFGPPKVSAFRSPSGDARSDGLTMHCVPQTSCSPYTVTWSLDDVPITTAVISESNNAAVVLNHTVADTFPHSLSRWYNGRLWLNDTGPWSDPSAGCLICEVSGCGSSETSDLCGLWASAAEEPKPLVSASGTATRLRSSFTALQLTAFALTCMYLFI